MISNDNGGVTDGVGVALTPGIWVDGGVELTAGVFVGVGVGLAPGLDVCVGVKLTWGVFVGVALTPGVGVWVGVWLGSGVGDISFAKSLQSQGKSQKILLFDVLIFYILLVKITLTGMVIDCLFSFVYITLANTESAISPYGLWNFVDAANSKLYRGTSHIHVLEYELVPL